RVLQIRKERGELLREHQPLVDDGLRRAARDVELVTGCRAPPLARRAPRALADGEEHALEGVARAASLDEELADRRHRVARHRAEGAWIDGDVAPTEDALAVMHDGGFEDGLLRTTAGGRTGEE